MADRQNELEGLFDEFALPLLKAAFMRLVEDEQKKHAEQVEHRARVFWEKSFRHMVRDLTPAEAAEWADACVVEWGKRFEPSRRIEDIRDRLHVVRQRGGLSSEMPPFKPPFAGDDEPN